MRTFLRRVQDKTGRSGATGSQEEAALASALQPLSCLSIVKNKMSGILLDFAKEKGWVKKNGAKVFCSCKHTLRKSIGKIADV